ncbi:MAG: type I 3-dehydroquinate dehydratase, partial [Smithella sp.]
MICIPITSRTNKDALQAIEKSCRLADFIELRMDLIGRRNLAELISAVRSQSLLIKIIITCRRKEEAAPAGSAARTKSAVKNEDEKMALLREAIVLGADFIDIELAEGSRAINELKALCAKTGGKTNIIISYHNLKETPGLIKLKEIFNQCAKYKPAIVKIVTMANTFEDNLAPLSLISYARKHSQKIISLCMGDKGGISRVVAPLMGGYLSFAALDREEQSAPGQFTIHEMNEIRKLFNGKSEAPLNPAVSLRRSPPKNFVLLGNPVGHSLSPLMHNAALQKMSSEEIYSACCVQSIGGALAGLREMNIHGAGVTIPFKVTVMKYLDDIDGDAQAIGAVNTIVNDNGRLIGYNTDWLGLMLTLKKAMTVKNKTFAVIGAGGTARAAAYGIIREGGFPVIINRSLEKGKILAEALQCPFIPLSSSGRIKADCLINTTSVGMYPHTDKSPMKKAVLAGYEHVMDVIYNPLQTKL